MKIPKQCPMCGSESWQCVNVYNSGFSVPKSFFGSLLLGKNVGIWLGLHGKRHKVYACRDCRFIMEYMK